MSFCRVCSYTALTGAKIDNDQATAVVDALQEHLDMQVNRSSEAVLVKLDRLGTRMDTRLEGMQVALGALQATLVSKIDAMVADRIVPLEAAAQVRVLRFRWLVASALSTAGICSAVVVTLHSFQVL